MKKNIYLKLIVIISLTIGCSSNSSSLSNSMSQTQTDTTDQTPIDNPQHFKILSLGDSYTIGQSVCDTCRFPEQLKDSLSTVFNNDTFSLKIVAQTGWTTTNLKNAIANTILIEDYELVTLLIGVNNQFQSRPFSLYETEFPELVNIAITQAKGDKNRVIVVSIPDYAYTPFGGGNTYISQGIDTYNAFAESYCASNNITFVNITDITRQGLEDPELVASDGLHPSTKAYSKFVERILPFAIEQLN
jgi:acyl-CoA thioesterase-1